MTDLSHLFPESPEPTRHSVELSDEPGPWGGPTRRYRGARIEVNKQEGIFGLFLVGHPMHGISMGNWENMLPMVDAWLDGRDPPQPYRWRVLR